MGCVFELGVLFGCLTFSTAGTHHLQYLYTATSGIPDFPEFTTVGIVNAEPISYYDSRIRKSIPRQAWMEMDLYYWEFETNVATMHHQIFKADIQILRHRFNQTGGVHVLQKMYGCMWNDDTGATLSYEMLGYDGEDFLTLDLENMRWIAVKPQALLSKQKWDEAAVDFEIRKNYFKQTCVEWLKKYVACGSSNLGRKVPPEVSLLQKYSAVVCHATGFYPNGVIITWKRDGEEMQEDVDVGEELPNEDGTFQRRAVLRVSPEERKKGQYTCEVAHMSGEPIIMTLPEEEGNILGIIIGCVISTGAVVGIVSAVMKIKREQKGYMKKTSKPDSVTSESSTTELLKSGTGSPTSTESLSTDSTNSGTGSLTSTESLSTYSTKSE